MTVELRVTAVFQRLLGGKQKVEAEGSTIAELLEDLERKYPGFKERVVNEKGELHQFVNIYVNDEDIRFLGNLETPLSDGDVVSILPALAGGSRG
jgi:MoaD family protein